MKIRCFVILLILLTFICVVAEDSQITWIEFPNEQFEVNGLPFWQENQPELYRLSKSAEGIVRNSVWNLSKSPSGGRIRFKSDCTQLAIRLQYPQIGNMRNMHKFGQSGVDLYVNGVYIKTAIPEDTTFVEYVYFENQQKQMREHTLYLPLYNGVKVVAIGMNAEANIEQADPFVLDKPVVYYGSSITQGGCASHPGMSYQAIVSRHLALDFVNLGYSGNGLGEPEVAEIIASMDASCYVMNFGINLRTADAVEKVYGPFLEIIRGKRPNTPIICVTPIYHASEFWGPAGVTLMRQVIRKEVAKRRAAGDVNIILVEGFELLGPEFSDGFVDGTHPNDLGFQAMAEGLQSYLMQVLNVSGSGYLLKR